MLNNSRTDIYNELLRVFGRECQITKTIEELSELQKELCKAIIHHRTTANGNLIEEIADVEIMLEQIKILLKIDPHLIEQAKEAKLARTWDMLMVNKLTTAFVQENGIAVPASKAWLNNLTPPT